MATPFAVEAFVSALSGPDRTGAARVLQQILTPAVVERATREAEAARVEERKRLLAELAEHEKQSAADGKRLFGEREKAAARVAKLESELETAKAELLRANRDWSNAGSAADRTRARLHQRLAEHAHPGFAELAREASRRADEQRRIGARIETQRRWIGGPVTTSNFQDVEKRMAEWQRLIADTKSAMFSATDEAAALRELEKRLADIGVPA